MDEERAVELDDKSHNADKDRQRDALLTAASYRVVCFQFRKDL